MSKTTGRLLTVHQAAERLGTSVTFPPSPYRRMAHHLRAGRAPRPHPRRRH
jgi:hypothetical protein